MRLLLAIALAAMVPLHAAKPSFKDMKNCQDCTAAGYGWCPKARKCGGFSNKECAGDETDKQRSKEDQEKWEASRKGEAASAAAGGSVLTLTAGSFAKEIKKHDAILVEFYAPWCGHCKKLAPVYEEAAKLLESRSTKHVLGHLDATTAKSVAREHGVRGYPTMIPFVKGVAQKKYTGERTAKAIADFVESLGKAKTEPAAASSSGKKRKAPAGASQVLELDDESFDAALKENELMMVEFYAPWCGHCKNLAPQYEKAAVMLKNSKAVLAKTDSTVARKSAKKYEITGFPTLKLFKNGEVFEDKYLGPRTAVGIANHMHRAAGEKESATEELAKEGLVLEMTWGTASSFMKHPVKKQILVCADFSKNQDKLLDDMADAAETLQGQFLFVYLDSSNPENNKIATRVGGSLSECPMLRMAVLNKGFKVYLPRARHRKKYTLNKKGLVKFAAAWSGGKLKSYLRSQPIPEPEPFAKVISVVGHTFEPMVMDADNDVILFIFMNGCKFCKAFDEKYEKVAEQMSSDSLTFARMNGPRNDVEHPNIPDKGSYPTVLLFPADDKKNPIKFEETHGDGVVEALIEFLSIYGSADDAADEED